MLFFFVNTRKVIKSSCKSHKNACTLVVYYFVAKNLCIVNWSSILRKGNLQGMRLFPPDSKSRGMHPLFQRQEQRIKTDMQPIYTDHDCSF